MRKEIVICDSLSNVFFCLICFYVRNFNSNLLVEVTVI